MCSHSCVNARTSVRYIRVWGSDRNRAFLDVRVFSPFAQSHCNTSVSQC